MQDHFAGAASCPALCGQSALVSCRNAAFLEPPFMLAAAFLANRCVMRSSSFSFSFIALVLWRCFSGLRAVRAAPSGALMCGRARGAATMVAKQGCAEAGSWVLPALSSQRAGHGRAGHGQCGHSGRNRWSHRGGGGYSVCGSSCPPCLVGSDCNGTNARA